MKTYQFDPKLVMDEMTEICAWARANKLVAETIPVEVHVDHDGNPTRTPRIDRTTDGVLRGTTTVPLLTDPPTFAALKPVSLEGSTP